MTRAVQQTVIVIDERVSDEAVRNLALVIGSTPEQMSAVLGLDPEAVAERLEPGSRHFSPTELALLAAWWKVPFECFFNRNKLDDVIHSLFFDPNGRTIPTDGDAGSGAR